MKRKWIAIGAMLVLVLALGIYFGAGYLVFQQLGDVRGSCDKHLASTPD